MREIRVSDLALESLRLNFGFGNFAIVKNLSVTKLEFDTQIDSVVGIVVICVPSFSILLRRKPPKIYFKLGFTRVLGDY